MIPEPPVATADQVWIEKGRGGLQKLHLRYGKAEASLYLQGAHIDSYKPDGKTEILWLSKSAVYEKGKAIRGGIPICWPWFGAHMQRSDRPQHGFARVAEFEVLSSLADDCNTRVMLRLASGVPFDECQGIELFVEIVLSDQLWIQLRTVNKSSQPVEVGAALHTYFQVSDIGNIEIPELTSLSYKDKTRDFKTFKQFDPLVVNGEVDRVFLDPPPSVRLVDSGLGRRLNINSWGNTDLVVWNPWAENARAMTDFDDQGYPSMICIEPANALDNRIQLKPGAQHLLGKSIQLLPR